MSGTRKLFFLLLAAILTALFALPSFASAASIPVYQIFYDANGGQGAPATQSNIQQASYTTVSTKIPTHPEGYRFAGWCDHPTANIAMYQPGGGIYVEMSNKTLYAVWDTNTVPSAESVVLVVHKDRWSGEILKVDRYVIKNGVYGPYEGYPTGYFPGYYYGIWESVMPKSGTIKAGETKTIVYFYSKGTGTVNVVHKDQATGAILRQDSYAITGNYGPYSAQTFTGYGAGTLAPGSDPASGSVASGRYVNVTYLYSRSTAVINVIYKDKDSNMILRQDTYTVNAGNYGPYNAMTFNGYEAGSLAAGGAKASGAIAAGETLTIIYEYAKTPAKATVNVVHKDRDTGAILRQDAFTVNAGAYGPYIADTFSGYEAGSLAAGSSPASGTIAAGQIITITYQYGKTPVTVTINVVHKDKDTGAVLRQDAYTVNAGNYGPYNAMTFAGYGAGSLAAGSAAASGTVGANQSVTVIYEYAKIPATATIIVEHRDQDTKAVLRSDTYTVNAGSYGPYSTMSFTGYGAGSWVVSSAPVSGTIAGGQTLTITFRYTKTTQAKATINVVHKDSATGAVLSQNSYSVNAGSYGPYNAMTFTGYGAGSLAAGSAPASGTVTAGQTLTITYVYTKTVQAKATVNLVHKDRDTGAVLKQDSYEVNEGNYGPYNAMVFTGYGTGSLASGSAPASGTVGGGQTITITYQYGKSTAKAAINVVHKNRDTGAVLQTDYHIVDPGSYGPYTASTFPGYGPGYLASNSAPASGTVAAGQSLTITYLYTGRATIYVVHKDRTTGAVLKSETFTVNAGAYGPYDAATIANYGPGTWYSGSAAPSGTVTAGQTITITYLYTRTTQPTATVIVEYRYHTGHGLIESETFTVNAGNYGPYNPKTIPGYEFSHWIVSSDPVSGTIKEGESVIITFCYLKPGEKISGAMLELDGLEFTFDGGESGFDSMAFTFEDEEPTSDESNEVQKEVDRSNTGFEFEDAGFVFEDTGAADTGFVFE